MGLEEGGDNATEVDSVPDLSKCGVNYCPAVENPDINKTEIDPEEDNFSATSYQLYILAGVYLACSILSAVVLALLLTPYQSKYLLKEGIIVSFIPYFRLLVFGILVTFDLSVGSTETKYIKLKTKTQNDIVIFGVFHKKLCYYFGFFEAI